MGNKHGTRHERKLASRKRAAEKKAADTRDWTCKTVDKYMKHVGQPQYHLHQGPERIGQPTPWSKLGGPFVSPQEDVRGFLQDCKEYAGHKTDRFFFTVWPFYLVIGLFCLLLLGSLVFRNAMRNDPQCEKKIAGWFETATPETIRSFCHEPESPSAHYFPL